MGRGLATIGVATILIGVPAALVIFAPAAIGPGSTVDAYRRARQMWGAPSSSGWRC